MFLFLSIRLQRLLLQQQQQQQQKAQSQRVMPMGRQTEQVGILKHFSKPSINAPKLSESVSMVSSH